jgi:hypothetical protein
VIAALLWGALGAGPGAAQPQAPRIVLEAKVTGDLVPVETLRQAVLTAFRGAIPGALDAELSLLSTTPPLAPLPAASAVALRAEISVLAPQSTPLTYTVPMTIANVALPWSDAEVLLVSNSPESASFGKVLYSGTLRAAQTVRLLYHHQNGSTTQQMSFGVTLSNPTPVPLTAWVAAPSSGVGPDELTLGYEVTRRFLDQYWHHAGFLAKVRANSTLPLFLHVVAPRATASGLVQLALVAGERLNLQVVARLVGETDPPTLSFAPDFDTQHQRGAFARPRIVRAFTHTVGGPPLVMTIGAGADLLHEEQSDAQLQGNYGVLYTFSVKLTNPRSDPVTLKLVMSADGGQARGTFLIDDKVVDSPVVRPDAPHALTTIHLAPLERHDLLVSTMPESGSNYPVRLWLGPEESP